MLLLSSLLLAPAFADDPASARQVFEESVYEDIVDPELGIICDPLGYITYGVYCYWCQQVTIYGTCDGLEAWGVCNGAIVVQMTQGDDCWY